MLEILLLSVVISAILSLIFTPLVMRLAVLVGAVDKPDPRKIHSHVMPRMGGVAVFVSFISTLILLRIFLPHERFDGILSELGDPSHVEAWLLTAVSFMAIIVLGVCDDIWSLKPGQKFLVQMMAGALVYFAGFRIDSVTNIFAGGTFHLGLFSLPFTVLWVVGITNAFNLIDGLDGLASGIALIASLTISSIALLHHDIATAAIGAALAGAVIGFLRYNFNPAKIFLGDSGSLFLGFTLAVLSIQSSTKGSTAFSVIVPLLALGVPIIDTSLAMLRRALRAFLLPMSGSTTESTKGSGVKKLYSMFLPDRRHIHHQLLAHGLSHRNAVMVLYVASCAFGLSAFLVTAGSLNASLVLVGVGLVGAVAVRKLGYHEMAVLRNGLILRFYSRTFLKNGTIQIILDMMSVFSAFLLARVMTTSTAFAYATWREWAFGAIMVSIIQLLAFVWGGVYKQTISLFGLGDLLQVLKATVVGVIATGCALEFLVLEPVLRHVNGNGPPIIMFTVLDFYFLVTLVVGSRVAFHAMNYIFRRGSTTGRKTLIYGADSKGMMALQTLLSQRLNSENSNNFVSEILESKMTPVGFLDDNPDMEGKVVDGYPVFGGHWKLEGLVNKMNIEEIVLTDININPTAFERLKETAERCNVQITLSHSEFRSVGHSEGEIESTESRQREKHSFVPRVA